MNLAERMADYTERLWERSQTTTAAERASDSREWTLEEVNRMARERAKIERGER